MKRHLIILSLTFFLLSSLIPTETAAQVPTEGPVRLLSASDGEAVIEIAVVSMDALSTETLELDGKRYQPLAIPGWDQTHQPGAPQLPTVGAVIGLPGLTKVSVEILSAETDRYAADPPPPAPTVHPPADGLTEAPAAEAGENYEADAAIYERDAFYPDQSVDIAYTGYLRDQAVARLQFYPVRTNPVTREIELTRRMVVRVSWAAEATIATATMASPAFEPLLQATVLNYHALNRPAAPAFAGGRVTSTQSTAADDDPTLKIGVTEDGLYALTYADLTGAGFNLTNLDPRHLKLQNQGIDIPIYIEGEADGRFDPTDTLLFYGTAMTGIYTAENIYRLSQGQGLGPRMSAKDSLPQGAPVPAHFPTTLHAEKDTFYWETMPNGLSEDNWFWGGRMTAPASRTYTLSLTNIATSALTATVRVRFKGRTSNAALNPDHHTKITLNGLDIEPAGQWWDGLIVYDHTVSTTQSNLLEGDNTVKVELVGDTGASVEQVYHNWIEIDYWDRYVAEADRLRFSAPAAGAFQFEISQFSSADIGVFDITNPHQVTRLTNAQVAADGDTYSLKFQDTAQTTTRYLALTRSQWQSPTRLTLDQPSAWKSSQNGADYVIISHRDFLTATTALANRRQADGMRVAQVDVEDLYDEFNYGIFDPQAIRDFLTYAYTQWQPPAPSYVVLVGDATIDYKDDYQTDTINYVPTQIVETDILGETPSDNWFVTISGADLIPDMYIGRLSAQSGEQVETIIAKILAYEQAPVTEDWNRDVLLVADDDSAAFSALSQTLAGLLPADFTPHTIDAADYPPGTPAQDVIEQINAGQVLVNYSGHGSATEWGKWQKDFILDADDIATFDNPAKLPVVTIANCLNGFFSGSQTQISVAEALQRHNQGGAVAVWAPTGLNYPSGHQALISAFYQALFEPLPLTLGQAATMAKLGITNENALWDELVETYVLFGDPATRLAIPAPISIEPDRTLYLPVLIRP